MTLTQLIDDREIDVELESTYRQKDEKPWEWSSKYTFLSDITRKRMQFWLLE